MGDSILYHAHSENPLSSDYFSSRYVLSFQDSQGGSYTSNTLQIQLDALKSYRDYIDVRSGTLLLPIWFSNEIATETTPAVNAMTAANIKTVLDGFKYSLKNGGGLHFLDTLNNLQVSGRSIPSGTRAISEIAAIEMARKFSQTDIKHLGTFLGFTEQTAPVTLPANDITAIKSNDFTDKNLLERGKLINPDEFVMSKVASASGAALADGPLGFPYVTDERVANADRNACGRYIYRAVLPVRLCDVHSLFDSLGLLKGFDINGLNFNLNTGSIPYTIASNSSAVVFGNVQNTGSVCPLVVSSTAGLNPNDPGVTLTGTIRWGIGSGNLPRVLSGTGGAGLATLNAATVTNRTLTNTRLDFMAYRMKPEAEAAFIEKHNNKAVYYYDYERFDYNDVINANGNIDRTITVTARNPDIVYAIPKFNAISQDNTPVLDYVGGAPYPLTQVQLEINGETVLTKSIQSPIFDYYYQQWLDSENINGDVAQGLGLNAGFSLSEWMSHSIYSFDIARFVRSLNVPCTISIRGRNGSSNNAIASMRYWVRQRRGLTIDLKTGQLKFLEYLEK